MRKNEYEKIDFNSVTKTEILKIISEFKKDLNSNKKVLKEWLLNIYIDDKFIPWLFDRKMYSEIISIFEFDLWFEDFYTFCLFEIAYSYSQIWKSEKAEEYYLKYLIISPESSAAMNNLWLICENKWDLDNAKIFFTSSLEIDNNDKIILNNLDRINWKIQEVEENDKIERESWEKFKTENSFIQNKMLYFSKNKNSKWEIICPYRLLPKFMWLNQYKAQEVFDKWLDNRYLIKMNYKDISWSNVYKINKYIETYLENYNTEIIIDSDLLSKSQKLDKTFFNDLWYNDELVKKLLDKIYHEDIKSILKRDLYELVITISLWLHKVSLILWWSLIEAILVDLLLKNKIEKINVNWKNKRVEEVDLSDLLNESYWRQFISNNLYHLAHWVRWFRNLVHPWAEYRKEELEVSKENVDIVWTILKKLINELK